MTSKLLFSITIEAVIIAIGGVVVVGESDVIRSVMIMRTMVGGMLGPVAVTKTAFILSAIFADVSWGTALMTYNTRGFGREVGSRDESCAYIGKLMIPIGIVDSWSVSRTDGDFDPRGRFGGDDDRTVRVTRVTREISVGPLSLFLLLSLFFISLS